MDKVHLNNLVISYREGDETALEEIFSTVNPLIEKASYEMEKFIDDFTKFDCRVIREIGRLVKTFDELEHDFLSSVKAIISRTKSQYYRRDSRKHSKLVSINALASVEDDDTLGYQFVAPDNVEEDVILNEKIALLAQGDFRKTVVLTEWIKGADDKSISLLLAQQIGGKAESHRKFITRFKTQVCRPFFAEMV